MDQAAALLALQESDLELLRLSKRLDELPEKRAILEVRTKRAQVAELGQKAGLLKTKLQAEIKKRTDEIDTLTEKIDAEQAKLMNASDHRAVQSLTREMDGLKRRRDKVEMETLEYEERLEKAEEQATKVEGAIAQLDKQEQAAIAKFQQVGGEIQQQIRSVEADRATYAGGLDADLLAQYESARQTKGGIGVGKLVNSMCTGCRMDLPAQKVATLRAGDDIGTCPSCRRILIVRMEGDDS